MSDSPEMIVQRQVDAYNAHDLDGFVATYHRDAAYLRHPSDEIIMSGANAIRQSFGDLFRIHPRVHVAIKNRMTLGAFVADMEEVTGREGLPVGHIIALYEVHDGLIEKVWVIRG